MQCKINKPETNWQNCAMTQSVLYCLILCSTFDHIIVLFLLFYSLWHYTSVLLCFESWSSRWSLLRCIKIMPPLAILALLSNYSLDHRLWCFTWINHMVSFLWGKWILYRHHINFEAYEYYSFLSLLKSIEMAAMKELRLCLKRI